MDFKAILIVSALILTAFLPFLVWFGTLIMVISAIAIFILMGGKRGRIVNGDNPKSLWIYFFDMLLCVGFIIFFYGAFIK